MTLTNPSLELVFVGNTALNTTVSNSDIVRQSVQIEWQMMNDLKSTSDKAKISITKNTPAVSRIMSFDGDIRATLKDGSTTLFTGFLSNKYKWSVTNHGEQVLSLTIEDNTRLLETIFSDKDRLVNESFYLPATGSRATASGLLVELATVCGFTILGSTPEIDTNIIKLIDADTECVDILDQCCFELGYCYKFNALGQLYLWQIAQGDEPVSATLTKDSLYAVDENAVIVNKSLKQYNRAIVKYTDVKTRSGALVYQDISGQDGTHPYCYIEVNPGMAYPSGLTIAGHTDDELKGICDVSDLDEGKTIIGIGDTITTEFECTNSAITCSIQKYSATQVSVLIKNTGATPIYILKLQAKATITYEDGDSKVYAGSVSDKKYYETELVYTHDNDTASELGNLIYQFYKHSNLSYQFYSKTQLALGSIIRLNEDCHSGISAKLMVNAIVDSSSTGVYQYVAYSFSPFNLEESTTSGSSTRSPEKIPASKTVIQYAIGDSVSTAPSTGWQYTTPTPTTASPYVWMRTSTDNGTTWAYARLTGEQGEDGGEYSYELIVHGSTFSQDRRSTGSQSISAYTVVTGYENVTSTITVTNATYANGVITIPLNNSFSEVVVTAVLTNSSSTVLDTKVITLTPVDITEAPMFIGCIAGTDAPPTQTTSGLPLIAGDHFCVSSTYGSYTKGDCYRYTETGWIKLNSSTGTPTEMLNCLNGFKEQGVSFSSISDSSATSWFEGIVANEVIANSIKAVSGFFDNITVGSSAIFNGTLNGSYLKTMNTTSSSTIYNSRSAQASGISVFYWSDIQDAYENYYSSSYYGTLLTASGSINGKAASKVVYHTSSSLSSTVETIASGSFPESISPYITIDSPVCTTRYKITIVLPAGYPTNVGYAIYNGSTQESQTSIVSGMAGGTVTVTTSEITYGKTLKLYATLGATDITYSVQLYHSDNYGIGTNVITTDGYKYNIDNSLPTNNYSESLTGTGTTKPSLTVNGTTWSVSSVQTRVGFPGQTGSYTAPTTGSSSNISSASVSIQRSGESSATSYSITAASWGATSITLTTSSGSTITLNESTSDLVYWYIYFTVVTTTGGVVSKGLQPWSDSSYNIGSNSNRWLNGYFDNIYSSSLSTDDFAVSTVDADNLYGQLGENASRYRNDAYVNTLYANAIDGVSFFDVTTDMTTYPAGTTITSTGETIYSMDLDVGKMAVEVIKYNANLTGTMYLRFSGSGTYGYCYYECSNYCNDPAGGMFKASKSVSTGTNISFTHTGSSGGSIALWIYWKKTDS